MAELTDAQKADLAIEDIHKHVVQTPYREYPRHVHKAGGVHLEVKSDAEKKEALADGWSLTPVVEEADEAEPEAAKPAKGRKPKAAEPKE